MSAGEQPAPYAAELVLLPTAALHGKPLHNTNGSRTMDLSSGTGSQSQPDSPTNLLPPVIWQHVYTNYDGALSQFMDTNTIGLKAKFYRVSPP